MAQLKKKIKINTTITLLTGLHVGGSTDNVEIGGIDNPVVFYVNFQIFFMFFFRQK